jgi:chromosome segregation ATPase
VYSAVKNARYIGVHKKAQGDARMSVQRQSAPSKDADLETTAELPVLDVAAYEAAVNEERSGSTDTWHVPAINAQAAQAASASGAAAIAAAEDRSLQLETDLRSLAENLRDVEERLTRRGERLIELERELASSRAECKALDQRTAALVGDAEARARAQVTAAETLAKSQIAAAEENAKSQVAAAEALAKSKIAAAEESTAALVAATEERASALVTATEARAAAAAADLSAARAELEKEQARAAALHTSVEEHVIAARQLEMQGNERASSLASRERELAVVRTEFFALETRATQYLESLHTLEGRRNIFDEQLLGLSADVAARDEQLGDLQQQLLTQTNRATELANDLAARTKRVESLEREVTSLAGSLGQRNVEAEQSGRTHSKLQDSVTSLTETLAARVERIKSLEAAAATQSEAFAERGKQIDTLTRERDKQIEMLTRERDKQAESAARERDTLSAKIAGLETALASAKADIAARDTSVAAATQSHSTLQSQLAANQVRIEQLERDLAVVRGESGQRATNMLRLESERDEQINRFAAAEARAVELERRIDDNAEVIRQLQEELRTALGRGTELEGDLTAAEDAINRLETELRAKTAKLDDLSRTQEEWRGTIDSARQSLAERDSLIHRLETEAANSAALLGNIQQSMRKFDTSQSGSHEIAPEGAVRLLIRVDGDSEVVHVLGRKTTVGRTPDNDLQIDAKFISRNHAVILAGPNHTIIEDLNSTNGIAVNGKRITRHTLRDGDNVAIGKTTFRFAVRPMKESRA